MLPIKPIILLSFMFLFFSAQAKENVFLCYGKVPVSSVKNYKYVIVEEAYYNKEEVTVLKQQNEIVICYISVGELDKYVSYFKEAVNYTLPGKNPIWDSYFLDISKPELQDILQKNITEKLAKGFDGLFLDNVDNYGRYGQQKHLEEHFLSFLKKIKTSFNNIYLMQNAGLDLVAKTHSYINSIAIESVVTDYNFKDKEYRLRDKRQKKSIIRKIKYLEEKHEIPFILIEYADTKRLYKKIKRKTKKHNWSLFVGQIDLQKPPTFN